MYLELAEISQVKGSVLWVCLPLLEMPVTNPGCHLSSDQPTETLGLYQLREDTNLSSLSVTDLNILWRYPCKYIDFSIYTDESLVISWQWFLMQISQRPQQAMEEKRKPSSNNQPMTPRRGSPFGKKFRASQVALAVKNPPANVGDTRDAGSIPGSGRCPGGGHGTHSSTLA